MGPRCVLDESRVLFTRKQGEYHTKGGRHVTKRVLTNVRGIELSLGKFFILLFLLFFSVLNDLIISYVYGKTTNRHDHQHAHGAAMSQRHEGGVNEPKGARDADAS
jgi:hypothetical protein